MADRPLRATTLVAYGSLGLPLAALNLPLFVYLPAFYANEVGLGLAAVGIALFAARILDTVTDPLIGELSDRLPTRFGRRRPWLVLACPLLVIATLMLFVPGEGAGVVYLGLWSCIGYLAWTAMLLPYSAWGAELSSDYHERSRITAAREGFVIVGVLLATGLPLLLRLDTELIGPTLAALGWLMAFALPAALVWLLAVVPEPKVAAEPPLRVWAGWKVAFANRPFRRLAGAYLLNGIANGLPATLFLLFVGQVLKLPEQAPLLLFLYFLAGVIAVPFWLRVSYRIGKHRAWAVAMLWASAAFMTAPLLGEGDFWPFLAICLLSGLALGADLALPPSIQADVVDLDRVTSGRRRTGLFFAIWSMITKLALAFAVGIAFPILEIVGFDPGGANSPSALLTLACLYGLVPVAIKVLAILLVWNFPITAESQAALRQQLGGLPAPAR